MSLRQDSLKRLTHYYLGFQVFFTLLFWLPVFYEVQKRLGLSDQNINGIQSFYYLVFCVLEIPTGYLADRFGLIRSLRWGALTLVVAHLVILSRDFGLDLSPYWAFAIHFSLIALARSLVSGASNAYLYEAYHREGRDEEYVHIEGKARAYGLVTKIFSWVGVGFLTENFLLGSYWLSLMSSLVACYFALNLREGTWAVSSQLKAKRNQIWTGFQLVYRDPSILMLMFQGMGVFVLARVVQVNVYQPLLIQKGFSVSSLGWIMAVMTAAEALGSLRLKWVLSRLNPTSAVVGLTGLLALVVASLAWVTGGFVVMSLILFSLLVGFVGPIQRQVINSGIQQTENRAVLLSMESLLHRAVCSVVASSLGGFLEANQLGLFLSLCGAVFVGVAVVQLQTLELRQLHRKGNRDF